MKFSNVKPVYTASAIDKASATYQRKIDTARQEIASAEYALAQDWCVGTYRATWTKTLTAAQTKLAKLEA